MKKAIVSENAPKAIGPYSQAIQAGNLLFLSGMLPIDPATGEFASESITGQTEQIFKNVKALLEDAGSSLDQVVKTTVFLSDMGYFAAMNEVYSGYFNQPYPARSAFAVKALPKNALVEIEVIAYIE
jgi:endoribonuclease L-PSP, putative